MPSGQGLSSRSAFARVDVETLPGWNDIVVDGRGNAYVNCGGFNPMAGEAFKPGRLHYWKSGCLRDMTDGAIETLMRFVPRMPSAATGIGLQQMHGAASRPTRPPLPSRSGRAVRLPYPFAVARRRRLGSERPMDKGGFRGSAAHLEDAVYVNNLGDEGAGRVEMAYGQNYPRLAAVKRTYDPDNLFRAN